MKYFSNDMGCVGIAIMLALLAIFPPLALVFIIVYALIADNIGIDNFIVKLEIIVIGLVFGIAAFSPVLVTFYLSSKFGLLETFKEYTLCSILAVIEIIIAVFLIKRLLFNKYSNSNTHEQPLYKSTSTHSSNHKSIYPPIQENNSQNDAIPNEKEAEKNTSKTVTKVYVTKSGKKYHQKNCDSIKHYLTSEIDLDTAKKQGYSPCHICCNKNNFHN